MQSVQQGSDDQDVSESDLQYIRTLGAYKPRFEGIPETYYPLNKKEVCCYVIIVLATMLASLGVMIGMMQWALVNFISYINAITALLLGFIAVASVLLFFGGKDRIRQERLLIEDSERRQAELAHKKAVSPD